MLERSHQSRAFVLENGLELQPLTMKFDRALFELIQLYRPWLRRWQNWPDRIRAINHMRQLIHNSMCKARDNDGYDWALVCNGRPAGKIGMLYIDWGPRQTELGYWLAPPFQGAGYMTRACKQVLAFIFDELQLQIVRIRCAEGNGPSRAIPERLGFRNEGRLPHSVNIHGKPQFEVMYSIDRVDWESQR